MFQLAQQHLDREAIVDATGRYSYRELLDASAGIAARLLDGSRDFLERRVAMLVSPGFAYVAAQWGIWRAGGVAVPLGMLHPLPELECVLDDAQVSAVVADSAARHRIVDAAGQRGLRLLEVGAGGMAAGGEHQLPTVAESRRAMVLYTSGTTSRPKGVVTTHGNIRAQIESLVQAWEWSADDRILHVLPLNHIHGIVNALCCPLWTGAACEMLPRFDAGAVWDRIARGGLTLFMAVPTIYAKLIAHWEQAPPERQRAMTAGCRAMRLIVSGSAALPVNVLHRWREISGHTLLERYGMTEIGMGLSNPLHGERVPGCVGRPLPGVEVRRLDEQGRPAAPDAPAELEVRGPGVFLEYWNRPEETRAAFRDGWFRTGDVTVVENGVYRILGRSSIDIIKTGGYKVSALEIEEVLREHADIRECAVVGVEDDEWGERVAAAVVLHEGAKLTLASLRRWSKQRLAPYKRPSLLLAVAGLPCNAMGKVQKPEVARLFLNSQPNHGGTETQRI